MVAILPVHTPALARATVNAGIRAVEVTLDSDRPLEQIAAVRRHVPEATVGAGTVTTPEELRAAPATGRSSPCRRASSRRWPTPPPRGACRESPRATTAGLVKLFAAGVLGPDYVRAIREPLPDIPLLVTGGLTPDAAPAFLAAGATAVGLGGAVFPRAATESGDADDVRSRVRRVMSAWPRGCADRRTRGPSGPAPEAPRAGNTRT